MGTQKMGIESRNITAAPHRVAVQERWQANNHKGGVLWFTGLSGSGKTTLAFEMEQILFSKGYQAYVLDGDNVRQGLSSDLGFNPEDRTENIRRIGEVAALFTGAGIIVLSAFISPYHSDRSLARKAVGEGFHEIYLSANLAICEARDTKGLYKKAHNGEISDFTGVSAPYECPTSPDLTIDTENLSIEDSTTLLMQYIKRVFKM